jgi:hypothetical protein
VSENRRCSIDRHEPTSSAKTPDDLDQPDDHERREREHDPRSAGMTLAQDQRDVEEA